MGKKLITTNEELEAQYDAMDERIAELINLNKQLIFNNEEFKRANEQQIEYIKDLKQSIYTTSRNMRNPVTNILGLSKLLEEYENYPEDLTQYLDYIQQSAVSLDEHTRELNIFIFNPMQNGNL